MSSPEALRPAPWMPGAEAAQGAVPAATPARFALWPLADLHAPAAAEPAPGDPGVAAEPAGPDPVEEAYLQGRADGEREALAAQERRVAQALKALAGAASALQAVRASYASEMAEGLYALAVAVAREVVQRELSADPAIVRDLVRRALDVLPLEGMTEVRLNPEDLAALSGELDLYGPGGRRLDLAWVADRTIERGGYVIETPQRVLDGQLEPALLALYERLRHG